MVSYSRGKAESLGMDAKVGIGSRVERYVLLVVFLIIDKPSWGVVILAIMTYVTVGQRMYHVWYQYYHLAKQEEAGATLTEQEKAEEMLIETTSENKEEDTIADA